MIERYKTFYWIKINFKVDLGALKHLLKHTISEFNFEIIFSVRLIRGLLNQL